MSALPNPTYAAANISKALQGQESSVEDINRANGKFLTAMVESGSGTQQDATLETQTVQNREWTEKVQQSEASSQDMLR